MANYSCKKFFSAIQCLATMHSLQLDRRTDGQTDRRTNDDNHANSSCVT